MYILFWISAILCALWSILAIVVGIAMAKAAGQKLPSPQEEMEREA